MSLCSSASTSLTTGAYRERMAWVTRTLARLGPVERTIRFGVWNVRMRTSRSVFFPDVRVSDRQGYPNIRTVDYWLGGEMSERHPQSRWIFRSSAFFFFFPDSLYSNGHLGRVNACHNKGSGYERRLEVCMLKWKKGRESDIDHSSTWLRTLDMNSIWKGMRFPPFSPFHLIRFDTHSYVYYTQLMQAEAISTAFRLWKRNWKGRGREYTAGALVWQVKDMCFCVNELRRHQTPS
jgi:hypothetical protein